ncbi:hypothetical protein OSTOST_01196 [Ostertagia ostertagi]
MLAALIFCSLLTAAFGTPAAVLKFSIRPDTVNVGTELPFQIDVLDTESKVFHRSALGLANKWKGQLRGFAIMKNISNTLALIKLGHPDLNQDTVAFSLKDHHDGNMKISTDQFRIVLSQSYATLDEFCVNATYNRVAYGLDLSIGVDGHYYTMQISLRNPPPICLAAPFAHDLVDLCVAFKDLDVSREKRTLSGCIELEGELIHMRVLRLHLGCFVMPI